MEVACSKDSFIEPTGISLRSKTVISLLMFAKHPMKQSLLIPAAVFIDGSFVGCIV